MKLFVTPKLEVERIELMDIITTSGCTGKDPNELPCLDD